jgi:hypothetical protein
MLRFLTLLIAVASVGCTAATAGPFRNVVNEPFATVANGPIGAVVVSDDGIRTATASKAATHRAISLQHNANSLRRAEQSLLTLQRLGLKSPTARATFPRRLVHLRNGQIVAPDLMRAAQMNTAIGEPTNELRFTFEGFSQADQTALGDYLTRALPVAYNVYGRPAFNLTVNIRLDPDLATIQGGLYDAGSNEIVMARLSGNFAEDSFVLLILVLQAFHDDAGFFYDSWELGFAGAAATAIHTRPGVAPGYDPISPGPFYATSVYEPQNQQDLGGPTFFPESGWSGMLVWRVAMSRSAWFKCWVEDDTFFRRFNEAYYANFSDDLPGNIPALRVLGSQVLPRVEGMPFQEWYQRQWVLDTSIRVGPKLFIWNIPLTQAIALVAEHFYTNVEGDETPRGGQARTTYWSYDFAVSLFAEEGNLITIPGTGENAGEGFLIPTFFNIGGPQNITVQVDLGSLRRMLPFPYGQRGFESNENNLYGSIIDANQGTIDVQGGAGLTEEPVTRGVWGGRITSGDLTPQQLTVTFTNAEEQTITRVMNVAWDSYVTFLHGSQQVSLTRQFSAAGSGLHLISFPLRPLTQNLPELLGVPEDQLLIARWDPQAPGANKYTLYPRTDPVIPGRAYWLRTFSDISLNLSGVLEPEDRPFVVPLKIGWNMIGSPRREPVDISTLMFEAGGEAAVSYQDAVAATIIQDGIFGYSQAEGYVQSEQMRPFEGYWIRCMSSGGALLRFPALAVDGTSAPASVPRTEALQWQLPITVSAGTMRSSVQIGVADDAHDGMDRYDQQAPPGFGIHLTARLDPTGRGEGSYLRDVRPASAIESEFSLVVQSPLPHTPVRLSWPEMSDVPDDVTPVLIDDLTGKRTYMRTSAGAELAADESGVNRRLRIKCLKRSSMPLVISSMSAFQGSAGAAEIVFALSSAADVEVEILNIAGRPVRSIALGTREVGQNTLSWNLRDNTGTAVPTGMYLVRMNARDDSGRQAQALRPVQVTR